MTSPASAKRTILTPLKGVSRAGVWSRVLMVYTLVFALAILAHQYLNLIIGQSAPAEGDVLRWSSTITINTILSLLMPFLYGGLGACVFLLRSCHIYIHERTFDQRRVSEYLNRILLGLVSGGVITLFVSEVAGDGDDVVHLSAAALGFLAGYHTEFLFQTIERVAQALLPKVGVNSVRKAVKGSYSPDGGASELVTDLLTRYEKAKDQASKDLIADVLKKAKDLL